MIAPTFLIRVAQFLISVIIIGGGLVIIWFIILYTIKLTVDAIEASNRDFFVWLREKWPFNKIILRRKRKRRVKENA